jgi:hypothetical protein
MVPAPIRAIYLNAPARAGAAAFDRFFINTIARF